MNIIASNKETTRIMNKYQLDTKKSIGQNFLIDHHIIEKIIKKAELSKESCVIEVGPGIGALTQYLSLKAGKVIAYDIDLRLKPVLEETLSDYDNIEIIFQDFLTVDLKEITKKLLKDYKEVVIVANLPYYITTSILEKIIMSQDLVDRIIVMMQKEVALKLVKPIKTKEKLPLHIIMSLIGNLDYLFTVPKQVFIPNPKVESAIIRFKLENKELIDISWLYDFINICFKQRRKTLMNNLKNYYKDLDIKNILNELKIDLSIRSEALSFNQWLLLYNYFNI
jgi:dimethyladenosine transferase